MAGLKELKRRQKTAMLIERMTGAMKMISRARYTSMQNEVRKTSGVCQDLENLAQRIMREMLAQGHVPSVAYARPGSVDAPWLLILMTSDSGLCGGFNQKLIKAATEWLNAHSDEAVQVLCVGKKGWYALQKRPGITFFAQSAEKFSPQRRAEITSMFKNGDIRGCVIIHGHFLNILKQDPRIVSVLPSVLSHEPSESGQNDDRTYGLLSMEPNAEVVLDGILEMLVQFSLNQISVEHTLSEHAARMNAMDAANDNAKNMIRRLKIQYNRLRQDRITKEIIEIVAGSEAAK
jgi:F-type H+-transporting ATPase subunit gamma